MGDARRPRRSQDSKAAPGQLPPWLPGAAVHGREGTGRGHPGGLRARRSQNIKTAAAMTTKRAPREALNLRIPAAERALLARAAKATGKTRTDFILIAAR